MSNIISLLVLKITRLRVGIGRPPAGWEAADYVLSTFPMRWKILQSSTKAGEPHYSCNGM